MSSSEDEREPAHGDPPDEHLAELAKRSSSPSSASTRGWEKIESHVFSANFPSEPGAHRAPSHTSDVGVGAAEPAQVDHELVESTPEVTPTPTPGPSELGSPRRNRKDGKRPRVRPEDLHHGINLLLGRRAEADLMHYHDDATRLGITVLAICTLIGFGIGTLRLHVGWTFGLLGLVAYVQRAKLERMRDGYLRDAQAEPAHAPAGEFVGESVSWLNDVVNVVWPMTNPDLFVSLLDLFEDTLRQFAPPIVSSVRVGKLSLGTTAFRILSIKTLPSDFQIAGNHRLFPEGEGEYVNIEATFLYHREARQKVKPKSRNIKVMLFFGVGMLGNVEVPVHLKITGLVGRIRLRIQLGPDPPFLSTTQISFPEMPEISINCRPMRTLDVMQLPFVAGYILKSMRTVLKGFTAPSAYTLDVSKVLLGSDYCGIICIVVRRARRLNSAAPANVAVSFGDSRRRLHRTRDIESHEPSWQEVGYFPVLADLLHSDVMVHLNLSSGDSPVGSAGIRIGKLGAAPGVTFERNDTVSSGVELEWSVGFFPRSRPRERERKGRADATDSTRSSAYAARIREMLDSVSGPSDDQRSGLLVIQVHAAGNLTWSAAKSEAATVFAVATINGKKVLQGQPIAFGLSPYFDDARETVCLDWHNARIQVALFGLLRPDAEPVVLGVVDYVLKTELRGRSQITSWHTIHNGSGHGRLRISAMFKPCEVDLPAELRCPEVGAVEISHVKASGLDDSFVGFVRATIIAPGGELKAETGEAGARPVKTQGSSSFSSSPPLLLPTLVRSRACLVIELFSNTPTEQSLGVHVVWLATLTADTPISLADIALKPRSRLGQLTVQNDTDVPPPASPAKSDGKVSKKERRQEPLKRLTTDLPALKGDTGVSISFQLRFDPGLTLEHERCIDASNVDTRLAYAIYAATAAGGMASEPMSRATSVDEFDSNSSDDDDTARPRKSKSSATMLKRMAASPFKRLRKTKTN